MSSRLTLCAHVVLLLALTISGCRCDDLPLDDDRALEELPPPPPVPSEPAPEAILGLPEPTARDDTFRRGVSLGLFVSTTDVEQQHAHYRRLLDEIRDVGATDLSLVVRWAQPDVKSTTIAPQTGITSDDSLLVWVIEQSKARGLRVFLMPIIHLEKRSRKEWRGAIRPADWDGWWLAYTTFILHYAELAKQTGVDLMAVGSELVSTENQKERWIALIGKVRELYKGKLTYSANWDHFEPVEYWDALDFVGVTAYQELTRKRDPAEALLVKGWKPYTDRLRSWAGRHGHKYLITEVGYPSHSAGAARPWDYRPRGQPDPMLQLRCYRAMFRVWHGDPRLSGLYVWNWFGYADLDDRSYTPRGKPAEHVLRYWYKDGRKSP